MYGVNDDPDVAALPFAVLGAAVMSGVATVSIFGFNLADGLTVTTGITASVGFFMVLAAFAVAAITNETDPSEFEGEQRLVAGGGAAAVLGVEFIPALNDFVTSSDLIGVAVLILVVGAYAAVMRF